MNGFITFNGKIKNFEKKWPGARVVSAADCHAGDSGSIPAKVETFFEEFKAPNTKLLAGLN